MSDLYKTYMESPITNTPPEELKKGHRIEDVGDAHAAVRSDLDGDQAVDSAVVAS